MRTSVVLGCVGAFLVCLGAQGPEVKGIAAQGRKIAAQVGASVVTVQLVSKSSMAYGGRSSSHESRREVPGTIISPDGLTVACLSSGDPSYMMDEMAGDAMSMRSEVTDVRIMLTDGTEVPAKVVLRDKDFDLMFIRPVKKPATPMKAVDLTKAGTVDLLDDVLILTRLGKVVNRTIGAKIVSVQGVVRKPRVRYVLDGMLFDGSEFGSPVMTLDGKAVGILATKMSQSAGGMGFDEARGPGDDAVSVIVPCQDVLKVAKQAPASPPKAGPKPSSPPTKK